MLNEAAAVGGRARRVMACDWNIDRYSGVTHNIQYYRRRRGSHARYTGEAVVSFVIVRVAVAEKQMQMTAGAAVDDHHPDPPRQPLNGGGLTMLQVDGIGPLGGVGLVFLSVGVGSSGCGVQLPT